MVKGVELGGVECCHVGEIMSFGEIQWPGIEIGVYVQRLEQRGLQFVFVDNICMLTQKPNILLILRW